MPCLPREPPAANSYRQYGLARFNEEIQRRSRVGRIFPNRQACLALLTALALETSQEWLTGRRYLNIEELKQERSRVRAGAEVVFTER